MPPHSSRNERAFAAESRLIRYAEEHKKPIGELESAEFQLGIFDRMTDTQQEQYLLENLDLGILQRFQMLMKRTYEIPFLQTKELRSFFLVS